MSFLIDTNVISELRKADRADAAVRQWFSGLDDEQIYLSVLTLGEIRRGVESIRRRDADSAASLDRWLETLSDAYAERIITVDRAVCEEWGRMSVPDPLPVVDGLLAATAKLGGLTLATRNVSDIERTGVPWVNPFEAG
ncbi:MAG TPA: type II toxin-antitoxin system VapC family toxin [Solirubrobacterales bacterium]|nr:type II toxin-antitoxin system VapC family toxin [Solirubrobacterales bacterium]